MRVDIADRKHELGFVARLEQELRADRDGFFGTNIAAIEQVDRISVLVTIEHCKIGSDRVGQTARFDRGPSLLQRVGRDRGRRARRRLPAAAVPVARGERQLRLGREVGAPAGRQDFGGRGCLWVHINHDQTHPPSGVVCTRIS